MNSTRQLKAKVELPGRAKSVHPPINTILDAVAFRLARLAAINERAGAYHFGKSHDVSLNQWRILGLVSALTDDLEKPNQAVSFSEVRSHLYMDKGQFSRTLKQLSTRGLLETFFSPTDARVTELKLTKRGQVLHDRLLAFSSERNEEVVSVLSPHECREFMRILEKLSNHNEALQRDAGTIQ